MNPNDISLQSVNKNFEYEKMARIINSYQGDEELKNIAKYFCKIYLSQQEVISNIIPIH